jgi:hypothetical protein
MTKNVSKTVVFLFTLILTVGFMVISVPAAEVTEKMKKKGVREPHQVHLEIARLLPSKSVMFSREDIQDWKGFMGSLRTKVDCLPFDPGMKAMIRSFKPGFLNFLTKSDQSVVINEVNRLLKDPDLSSVVKSAVPFSASTRQAEQLYKRKWTAADLEWFNRSILNDMFPQTPRVNRASEMKYAKMRNFVCEECHEFLSTTGIKFDENYLKEFTKTERYIVRPYTARNSPFPETVIPENPYIFKPTLNRLVCIECHSPNREVKKILNPNGEMWSIPVFYGAGPRRPTR